MRRALWTFGLLASAAGDPPAVEVSLELRKDGQWEPVDSTRVFDAGDEIRFRFRSSFPGYLYVLNRTSNGETAWLYPRPEEGHSSRVEPGPSYLVPGTRGSFAIGGAPGFDTTYWVVSASPIETRTPELAAPGSQPSTLVPRCRDQVLKSRGVCVDERAGPRPLGKAEPVPKELGVARLAARDLTFRAEPAQTRISAKDRAAGVIVYEFRIAHR
jgi:hypothetical protein